MAKSVVKDIAWPQENGPWALKLRFGAVDGRVECLGCEIGAADLRSPRVLSRRVLRDIPLGRLIDDVQSQPSSDLLSLVGMKLSSRLGDLTVRGLGPLADTKKPVGRREISVDHLRKVADVYLTDNRAPTKRVAHHFNTSHSTATKWVAKARREGLLKPTSAGKVSGRSVAPGR